MAKDTDFSKKVAAHRELILTGKVVAIDPASVRAGWAVSDRAVFQGSGVLEMDKRAGINERLWQLYDAMTILVDEPDVLVVERIRGRTAHAYLSWAVGVTVGAIRAPILIEVPTSVWRAYAGKEHVKDDEADAKAILDAVIHAARKVK